MKKKKTSKALKVLDFKTAFNYPFNRAKGMWNILWLFLPIFGWFALGGYSIRIIQEFSKGKFKKLPIFKFKSDMKLGFFMFLKSLPFMILYLIFLVIVLMLSWISPQFELIETLIEILILPILFINFINKMTIDSLFEFKILKYVFKHFGDYVIAFLKGILLAIVFVFMSIILVGIPALFFTYSMFLADFYRRRVKK